MATDLRLVPADDHLSIAEFRRWLDWLERSPDAWLDADPEGDGDLVDRVRKLRRDSDALHRRVCGVNLTLIEGEDDVA